MQYILVLLRGLGPGHCRFSDSSVVLPGNLLPRGTADPPRLLHPAKGSRCGRAQTATKTVQCTWWRGILRPTSSPSSVGTPCLTDVLSAREG